MKTDWRKMFHPRYFIFSSIFVITQSLQTDIQNNTALYTRAICPKVKKYKPISACERVQDKCKSNDDCSNVDEQCCPTENQCYLSCQKAVVPENYCPVPIDLAILLDSSGSIGRSDWEILKRFIKNFIDRFDISENGTHVGIVTYSSFPDVVVNFNTYAGVQLNAVNIKRVVDRLRLLEGYTYIDKALIEANNSVFIEEAGMRKTVPKICYVITDGVQTKDRWEYTPLRTASQPIKDKGVEVYSLGVGNDIEVLELFEIASIPNNVFSTTFLQLSVPQTFPKIPNLKCREVSSALGLKGGSRVPLSTTQLIGVGLGSGVLVLLIFLLILYEYNKKKTRNHEDRGPWEIKSSKVELLCELGQGAFGKVWKGRIDRNVIEDNSTEVTQALIKNKRAQIDETGLIVAVKMLQNATVEGQKEFLGEIEFMKDVGYHRNIISMIACCTKVQVFLVVEYAEHGDLLSLLKNMRKKTYAAYRPNKEPQESTSENEDDDSEECLSDDLMSFSWQIAQGMDYLSSKRIVHRDLACRNILVAENKLVKVADFGLSRHVTYDDQIYHAGGRRKLPLKWMSPEAIDDQIFTSKSDVWSYAVVLWEIYTLGKLPYRTVCNQQLLTVLQSGYRMEKPDLCPDDMYELMRYCWSENPPNRPSFSDIIKSLEILMTRDKPYVEFIAMDDKDNQSYNVSIIPDKLEKDASQVIDLGQDTIVNQEP